MVLINTQNILGIVTEYNPFHNGHLYHLQASKEKTSADYVVAVMSGHFTQRGEPAIADPWTRAEWAIRSGVDLVLELPTLYATSSAAYFAHGSIAILNAIGSIDSLCFGSETGNIDVLINLQQQLKSLEPQLIEKTRSSADQSFSIHRNEQLTRQGLHTDTLTTSNDILGLAYLDALKRLESPIKPQTIKRIIAGYHDDSINNSIASATAIRKALATSASSDLSKIAHTLPVATLDGFHRMAGDDIGPNLALWQEWSLFYLRHTPTSQLQQVHDMASGLEQRMKQAALTSSNYAEFESKIKTKIYTNGRLNRVLTKMLLGITKQDLLNDCQTNPEYIRVLGFNERGRAILNQAKPSLPLITNGKQFYPATEAAARQWSIDCLAADLYALLKPSGSRRGNVNFSRPPVYIKNK